MVHRAISSPKILQLQAEAAAHNKCCRRCANAVFLGQLWELCYIGQSYLSEAAKELARLRKEQKVPHADNSPILD